MLSRLLYGGRSVIGLALIATLLAYAFGMTIGLIAGYTKSRADPILMRTVDVMLAFPPLLFLLVLITGAGTGIAVLVIGVAAIQAPGISRIVRTATLEVSVRGYVEAAVARGERAIAVVVREVLPNILAPVLVDSGLRFTYSILIIASVNFLGLGLQPPNSDWALMISENRQYISLNAWAVLAPAAMIALLTIGINLTGDAIARSLGRSYVPKTTRSVPARMSAATAPPGDPGREPVPRRSSTGEPVVEDVSFSVDPGEILGLVGESGSGKTTTALCAARLHPRGRRTSARAGRGRRRERCSAATPRRLRKLRGKVVSYVPQDPGGALNPSLRIGDAIMDVLQRPPHRARPRTSRCAPRCRGSSWAPTRAFGHRYPHQLSGGQQQRVTIAMACVCEPPVAVLDEPTTGLDVLTQDRILTELTRLRDEDGMAMVYVSHDLAVVAKMADRIVVMYAGRVVESGPAADVIERPRHPYTRALVAAIPDFRRPRALQGIPGVSVGVGEWPQGCAFAPRCEHAAGALQRSRCPSCRRRPRQHGVRCCRWEELPRDRAAAGGELRANAAADADASAATPLLEVADLHVDYRSGALGQAGGRTTSRSRSRRAAASRWWASRAAARPRSAGASPACTSPRRAGSCSTAPSWPARPARRAARPAPADPDRLPEPVRVAQPAPPRQLVDRAAAAGAAQAVARPTPSARSASCSTGCACRARVGDRFPIELSGGERQRVAIARALAAKPDLLVCDEVTSALDVSVQAAVLELLSELQRDLG